MYVSVYSEVTTEDHKIYKCERPAKGAFVGIFNLDGTLSPLPS